MNNDSQSINVFNPVSVLDQRDGIEAATSEIVLKYVGHPSLFEYDRIKEIIQRNIQNRGIKKQNIAETN